MAVTCAKCGSDKVVLNAKLFDQGQYSDGTLKAALEQNPDAWLFKGIVLGNLRATICGQCGFTELYAENSQAIYQAYRPSEEDDVNCLQCGAPLSEQAAVCASCGWTYNGPETD